MTIFRREVVLGENVLSIEANLIDNLNEWQKVVNLNQYTVSAILASLENNDDEYNNGTHLDSHTNVAVYGKHYWVVANTGFKTDVTAFSEEVG